MQEAELFDLDGTLVDNTIIRRFEPQLLAVDYRDVYQEKVTYCPPNLEVAAAFRVCQQAGRAALVPTARQRKFQDWTEEWLAKWELVPDGLWMRNTGDPQSDVSLKEGFLTEILSEYTVVRSWEDNPHVAKMYADRGIPTELIPGYVEEKEA